ncbi:nitrogenase component 1 [Frigidibacter mobilis]|nr:nitrogenase component 1 [Frigidibacter mobilis]
MALAARSVCTLAIGEQMRGAARIIENRAMVPAQVFPVLTGLKPVDGFVRALMEMSGTPEPPPSIRRDRARLMDAMLDSHFFTGGLRVAIAADPDLMFGLGSALAAMGAEIVAAVTTSQAGPVIGQMPCESVILGDLGDFERAARAGQAQILLTHSHGRHAAHALHLPLLRVGFPVFDRIGAQDACRVGYRGSRAFLYEIANAVQAIHHRPRPEDFGAAPPPEEFSHVPHPAPC